MKISILTLGCRTNQAESIHLQRVLSQRGLRIVDFSEKPDICIINTCAVTSEAERQSRQLINKTITNGIKTIITGCYGELKYNILDRNKENIIFIKNKDKTNIINILSNHSSINNLNNTEPLKKKRPIIKVQEGCENNCTYCSIPLTRGKPKSIPVETIIDEIIYYQERGYKEIVLTGTQLGSYGKDMLPKKNLSMLLKEILNKSRIQRIRLSSLDISNIDEELLEVISSEHICKHLHLPLQSGDDHILKLMNRNYTISDYESVINRIIDKFPDISIGTDVIVGFPGETEDHFKNTKKFIESMPYSYLHIFPYSKRPYTSASTFPEQIPDSIKKRRASELRELSKIKKISYIERFINKILSVLIEDCLDDLFVGTSDNYIKVFVRDMPDLSIGMLVNIKLVSIQETNAFGNIERIR
jgi:threonylcarbamoyladenosine tRNA methylthiotransferase MtaB